MDYNDPREKDARELEQQAHAIRASAERERRKAVIAQFVRVEGWEKKLTEAVLASAHAGENGGHVELARPEYDSDKGEMVGDIHAWVSFHLDFHFIDRTSDEQ